MAVFLGSRSGEEVSRRETAWKTGKRTLVNVGEDTTLGDGDVAEKLVQLLIVADGKLEMTGNDTGLLVVAGSVTGQLEDFSSKVLEDGGEVDGSTGTDTLGVVALAEKTVDTTDREGETGLGRTAGALVSGWRWRWRCDWRCDRREKTRQTEARRVTKAQTKAGSAGRWNAGARDS